MAIDEETDTVKGSGANEYQIWNEGYAATGQSAKAEFLGIYKGNTFKEAVENALKDKGWDMSSYNPEYLTYWGCRFFDNEKDARRAFG